ncbi:GAF domain-containing sensor histidine kinase [Maribius pontilimi]|uniref:histidine kinase n=1 Tax=Palleronia pontilimi TaxID=1964209 RepID=A0A934M8H8_9RHOB|nr:GAF domain-containing sensor histidine kinase [Palleronia pontilimi]MBJ3761417.1 GAF domain-containing sensor histidine kinase [Palleronia pontilimi]
MNDQSAFPTDVFRIQSIEQIPLILELCARFSGMRLVAVARVTDSDWISCAALDHMAFGLDAGDALALETTLCQVVRQTRTALVIDDVAQSDAFADHPSPALYKFRSYIGVPILQGDGSVFGTLVAIDGEPRDLTGSKTVEMFELFADLIGKALDERARLVSEQTTATLREEFIGVVGHDLRNPISAVSAGLRIIERTGAASPDLLVEMRRAMDRCLTMIDNLLDLTRGRLGDGIETRIAPVDLAEVIGNVVAETRLVDTVKIDVQCDLPDAVGCDAQRMGQLVSNILANAVDHHEPGTPITLEADVQDGVLRVAITNRGQTIPAEAQARLFLPFRRGHSASRNGLGLGLYIASQVAQAHGGRIDVVSDNGITTFSLTMPADLQTSAFASSDA